MDKEITTTTRDRDLKESELETSMMFEGGIKIDKKGKEIETSAIKIWSSREYGNKGPYQTLALVGTPCTPFYERAFYTKETDKKEEMRNQHFDMVQHFQKMYLDQKNKF